MGTAQTNPAGPDLAHGVPVDRLADGGMLAGHVGEEPVLVVRRSDDLFAVGATCTHYGGPLADGLAAGDTVRCPWHHACFSLKTGEALHAPAFSPLACWEVEQRDNRIFVQRKKRCWSLAEQKVRRLRDRCPRSLS
jgi:apoptosis-inducing factor 3